MDRLRVGIEEPVQLFPRRGDRLSRLKPGDVVRGRVVQAAESGELSLRIAGTVVRARSTHPIPVGASLLFRVLSRQDAPDAVGVRLHLLQMADVPEMELPGTGGTPGSAAPSMADAAGDVPLEALRNLVRELQSRVSLKGAQGEDLGATVRQLLKALPQDPASLPRELRRELLGMLRWSLRDAGEGTHRRAALLLRDSAFRDWMASREASRHADAPFPGTPFLAEAGKILGVSMKSLLRETGVAFESKLRALAKAILAEEEAGVSREGMEGRTWSPAGVQALPENDLKAILLQLRRGHMDGQSPPAGTETAEDAGITAGNTASRSAGGLEKLLPMVEGLLRDIELFQLLSKLTGSFYTFLPLIWRGLREGDIAFKRSRSRGSEPIHYCVLNLDFEVLGRLLVVAMLHDGDCFLSFRADHEGFQSALRGSAHELEEMFRREGLRLGGISFPAADDPQLASFENLDAFESVLSLKI